LLKPGGLWEWRWRQPHPCGGCSALIAKGEIEVEIITRGGVALILHRRCLELWEQEARTTPSATARPEPQRRRNLA